MVMSKFVNLFDINNFVSQQYFRIPHRFGAKCNCSFLITFIFMIKTKTTFPIKKCATVDLYNNTFNNVFYNRIFVENYFPRKNKP